MTSNDIKKLLHNKYCAPSYAFFTEVGSSTGGACRYADGIAASLWPSTGFEFQGFEIKTSHSDFLNELKRQDKSDEIMKFCDRWWIVAPAGIVKKEELPATWGLIEVKGNGKLYTTKHAPLLKHTRPEPGFIAMLLRRATEGMIPYASLDSFREDCRKIADNRYKESKEYAEEKLKNAQDKIKEFEDACGINPLDSWKGGKEIGEAVKFVLNNGFRSVDYHVEEAISCLEKALGEVKIIKKFDKNIKD